MKEKVQIVILGAMLFSVLGSCRKDPYIPYCERHQDKCHWVEDVKDFFYFKHGTYWVYEEENSLELDSVYVVDTYENPDNYYFTTKVYSTYTEYYYRYWSNLVGMSPEKGLASGYSTLIKMSKGKPGDFVSEKYIFKYWMNSGDSVGAGNIECPNNERYLLDIHASLSIEGNEFEDVYELEEECTASENYQHAKFYYSRHHGLIKKVLIDSNEIWNLVRYNHIQ